MKSHFRPVVLSLCLASTLIAPATRTQQQPDSSAKLKAGEAVVAAAPDTVKKKHGMFGKLKSVAQNKTVQNIAKTAACTAVPGGSLIVSAMDAHKAGASAATAAGVAAGAGGANCTPGIPGMGMKGMPGMAGLKGVPGAGTRGLSTAAAASVVAAQTSAVLQTAVMNGSIARASSAGSVDARGAPQSAGTQEAMTQMQTAAAASGVAATEAAGQQIQLSGKPEEEIRKGKLVIKRIDWIAGSAAVSAPSMSGFVDLMHAVGDAVKASGAKYRVDIYMSKGYSDADIAALAPQRVGMMISLLQDRAQSVELTTPGNIKKDKEQRVEIVKIK